MGFGRGDAPDLIDYTALKKRGIIKSIEPEKSLGVISKDGYLDFTNVPLPAESQSPQNPQFISSQVEQSLSDSKPSTFTSFWDALPGQTPAQTSTEATNSNNSNNYGSISPYYSDNSSSQPGSVSEINQLKLKIEDLEYKISRLVEKLETVTSKLSI